MRCRKAMKFAPARKFGDFFTENGHQRQYFMKFCKNDIFMRGALASFSASPVGRMLHFIDLWHHLNVFDLYQISATKKNLHISRKSKITDRKISSPFRTIDRKITLGAVLLYKHSALRVI